MIIQSRPAGAIKMGRLAMNNGDENLGRLTPFDGNEANVVIDTPRYSRNKYKLDKKSGMTPGSVTIDLPFAIRYPTFQKSRNLRLERCGLRGVRRSQNK